MRTIQMKEKIQMLRVFNPDPDPNPKKAASEIMIGMILQSYGQDEDKEESETDEEV